MGGHSSGPSAYEMAQQQERAAKEAEERLRAEEAEKVAKANAVASTGTTTGGEGTSGALTAAAKKRKGATLAGEGESTFSRSVSKMGE